MYEEGKKRNRPFHLIFEQKQLSVSMSLNRLQKACWKFKMRLIDNDIF